MEKYYKILGVESNESFENIKRAYRKLSLQLHPDKNNNIDNTKFLKIKEAYEILYNYKNDNDTSTSTIIQNYNTNESKILMPDTIVKEIEVDIYKIFTGTTIPLQIDRTILINNITHKETETIYIDIKQGSDDKEIIIIKNKGNIINSLQGDIKLFLKLINNTPYKRNGLDLILDKTITLKESLCGFEFSIEFLDLKIYNIVNYNNIISCNESKILHNMGLTRNNITGNLIINFSILFPKILDPLVIKFLEKHLT